MKIISWNVGGGYVFDLSGEIKKGIDSHEDFSVVIDFLEKENADIVMLQEMHFHDDGSLPFSQLWSQLGYEFSQSKMLHRSHVDSRYQLGFLTLSRLPIIESDFAKFPEYDVEKIDRSGRGFKYFPKGVLWTKVVDEKRELLLGNTHTTPFYIFKRTYEDEVLADHVRNMQKTFLSHQATLALIAGDFNFGNIAKLFPEVIGDQKPYREILHNAKTNIWDDIQKEHCLLTHNTIYSSIKVVDNLGTDHFPLIVELG